MLNGHAIPDATQTFADAHPDLTYRPLSDTGLLVSDAGFGCYRVDVEVDVHHEALRLALQNGVNVVDTSSNYADGGSEELVGVVLRRLDLDGDAPREAVVVVSKVGYLQGKNYALSQQRKASGNPFPDLVEVAEGLEHCIHPDFLQDQLGRSLGRLNLETLDVYLLHNPEYYLGWAEKAGVPLEEAREEYYRRIALAFRHLEEEVARGRIKWYGISSNTFPSPAGQYNHTSLARVWEIAAAISPDHHFRVVQMPMNLVETGAATEPNQPDGQSVLAYAREKDLAVLVNRPLNAIEDDVLVRLADVEAPDDPDPAKASTAVDTLLALEMRFREKMLPTLPVEPAVEQQLGDVFAVGQVLKERWPGFGTWQNWRNVQGRYIVPSVQNGIDFLSEQADLPAEARYWLDEYVEALNAALVAVGEIYREEAVAEKEAIKQQVAAADAAWAEADTLSQMAIRALRSTAGVTTVLVGMRHRAYVEDVLAELRRSVEVSGREASWEVV